MKSSKYSNPPTDRISNPNRLKVDVFLVNFSSSIKKKRIFVFWLDGFRDMTKNRDKMENYSINDSQVKRGPISALTNNDYTPF